MTTCVATIDVGYSVYMRKCGGDGYEIAESQNEDKSQRVDVRSSVAGGMKVTDWLVNSENLHCPIGFCALPFQMTRGKIDNVILHSIFFSLPALLPQALLRTF